MAMISAAEQNVTDAVEEGVAELAEQIDAQGRKVDARASLSHPTPPLGEASGKSKAMKR